MKRAMVYSILVVLILFCSQLCFAQSSGELKALKDDVKALKDGQSAIRKDLQEIKRLLQTKQAPVAPAEFKEAIINVKGAPSKGDKNAKLALIEFSDYQ